MTLSLLTQTSDQPDEDRDADLFSYILEMTLFTAFPPKPHIRPIISYWYSLKHTIVTSIEKRLPQKTPSNRHTLHWFFRDLYRLHRKSLIPYTWANKQLFWKLDCFQILPKNISPKHQEIWTRTPFHPSRKNVTNNPKHFFFKSRKQDTTPITALTNTSNIPVTHLEHKTRLLNTHFYFHIRKRQYTRHAKQPLPSIPTTRQVNWRHTETTNDTGHK